MYLNIINTVTKKYKFKEDIKLQNLIGKLNDIKVSNKEKQNIYFEIIKTLQNKDMEFCCVLDPNMILEETSIPYVISADGIKKALLFSRDEYAKAWANHYNVKYNEKPLTGKLTFSEFYKMLAVAFINGAEIVTVDDGQESVDLFIPDIFTINGINFTENIIMPRVEI